MYIIYYNMAIYPQSTMFISVYRLVRRSAPSSLAIYTFENTP